MKKKKLSLDNIKVQSFITNMDSNASLGGRPEASGEFGPICISEFPNCEPSGEFGPICVSEFPNCGSAYTDCNQATCGWYCISDVTCIRILCN